jgi:hypothetical protein
MDIYMGMGLAGLIFLDACHALDSAGKTPTPSHPPCNC